MQCSSAAEAAVVVPTIGRRRRQQRQCPISLYWWTIQRFHRSTIIAWWTSCIVITNTRSRLQRSCRPSGSIAHARHSTKSIPILFTRQSSTKQYHQQQQQQHILIPQRGIHQINLLPPTNHSPPPPRTTIHPLYRTMHRSRVHTLRPLHLLQWTGWVGKVTRAQHIAQSQLVGIGWQE